MTKNTLKVTKKHGSTKDNLITLNEKNIAFDKKQKTLTWQEMLDNYHRILDPFNLIGRCWLNTKTVKDNIKRLNEQSLKLESKKLKRLLPFYDNNSHTNQLLSAEKILLLIKAGRLFSVPPLLLLTENMQTPYEYACEQLNRKHLPQTISGETFKKRFKLYVYAHCGNFGKLYKKANITSKKFNEHTPLEHDILLPYLTQCIEPYGLWIVLSKEDDFDLEDEIIDYYLSVLHYDKIQMLNFE